MAMDVYKYAVGEYGNRAGDSVFEGVVFLDHREIRFGLRDFTNEKTNFVLAGDLSYKFFGVFLNVEVAKGSNATGHRD